MLESYGKSEVHLLTAALAKPVAPLRVAEDLVRFNDAAETIV
jgi:hypothetical protein